MMGTEATELKESVSGPIRMCVICRKRLPKIALHRYVCNSMGNLERDELKIIPGRGWYCCPSGDCISRLGQFRPRGGKKKSHGR